MIGQIGANQDSSERVRHEVQPRSVGAATRDLGVKVRDELFGREIGRWVAEIADPEARVGNVLLERAHGAIRATEAVKEHHHLERGRRSGGEASVGEELPDAQLVRGKPTASRTSKEKRIMVMACCATRRRLARAARAP